MGVDDWQKRDLAKPAEPVNGQDERRIRAAVDSPALLFREGEFP